PGALGYLMQRQLVAEIHPPNFAHHFHTDHPVFSCSKIEQKQLNTWVSFQSAEQPLLGQFSVSGNRHILSERADERFMPPYMPPSTAGCPGIRWENVGNKKAVKL
ncbi:hypothetical protein N5C56_24375, partial [Pseudomonas chengduensis]